MFSRLTGVGIWDLKALLAFGGSLGMKISGYGISWITESLTLLKSYSFLCCSLTSTGDVSSEADGLIYPTIYLFDTMLSSFFSLSSFSSDWDTKPCFNEDTGVVWPSETTLLDSLVTVLMLCTTERLLLRRILLTGLLKLDDLAPIFGLSTGVLSETSRISSLPTASSLNESSSSTQGLSGDMICSTSSSKRSLWSLRFLK